MTRLAGLAAVLFAATAGRAAEVSPDPATLAVPAADAAKARGLVRQLGSEAFHERDAASRALEAMGRAAVGPLADARDDPDPEVRMRVGRLLPRAEAEDLRVRVDTFLADTKQQYEHHLPGWHRFRSLAGDDAPARALFTAIVRDRDNHPLLLALRGVPAERAAGLAGVAGGLAAGGAERPPTIELARAVVARRRQMQARVTPSYGQVPGFVPQQPTLSDAALVLLAESFVPEGMLRAIGPQYQVIQTFYKPECREAMKGLGDYGPAFRRVAVRWLDTRETMDGLRNAMNAAAHVGLGDRAAAKYAARMLAAPGTPKWNQGEAIANLVKYRGAEHALGLARYFDDAYFLSRHDGRPETVDILLGDAALAAAVRLTGQDPKAYGFAASSAAAQPGVQFQSLHYRFVTDDAGPAAEKRVRARSRWQAWEAAQTGGVLGAAAAARLQAVRLPDRDPAAVKAEFDKNAAIADALP